MSSGPAESAPLAENGEPIIMMTTTTAAAATSAPPHFEWVLLVPPRLAQSAHQTLIQAHCVPRPWHAAGRYGSRTHKYQDSMIGIPLSVTDEQLFERADNHKNATATASSSSSTTELSKLLYNVPGVTPVYKEFTRSPRQPAIGIEQVDARIHPERAPTTTTTTAPPLSSQDHAVASFSFTFAELFCGIGGFGVALEALGGKCVFSSELDPNCRQVYKTNSKTINNNNLHGDIYQVADSELPVAPALDLLVGGFPCQPFSAMGQQPGLECAVGNLFLQIVRVLNVSKPRAFLLENVPGLLRMRTTLDTIVAALRGAGYHVTVEVCSSRGLTATSRKRLFFVGLRRPSTPDGDSAATTAPIDDSPQEPEPLFEFPYIPDLQLRCRDVIHNDTDYTDAELDLLRVTDQQLQRLCQHKKWKPAHLAWPDTVCQTLVSHYGNSIGKGDSQLCPCNVDSNPRRFSPRECARIMGFPASFVLPEQRDTQGDMAHFKEQYRMFGNAVCPPVIAALAGAVLAKCPGIAGYEQHADWVAWGRETAVRLAYAATISGKPTSKGSE